MTNRQLYIETRLEDEAPIITGDYITNHGKLYYSFEDDIWAREGDYAPIPTWWLKEINIDELTIEQYRNLVTQALDHQKDFWVSQGVNWTYALKEFFSIGDKAYNVAVWIKPRDLTSICLFARVQYNEDELSQQKMWSNLLSDIMTCGLTKAYETTVELIRNGSFADIMPIENYPLRPEDCFKKDDSLTGNLH